MNKTLALLVLYNLCLQAAEHKKISVVSEDGQWIVESCGDWAYVYHILNRSSARAIAHYGQQIEGIALSPDARFITFSSANNKIRVWDTDINQFISY